MANDLLSEFQTELENAWKQLEVIFTIAEIINKKPEFKSLEDVLILLSKKLNAEKGIIFLRELEKRAESNKMLARAVYGLNPKDWVDKYIISLDEGLISEIAKGEIPKIENDIPVLEKDPFFSQLDFKTESFLGVPIRLGEQVIGILCVFNKGFKEGFTDTAERLASAVALELAIIIAFEQVNILKLKSSQEKIDLLCEMSKTMSLERNYIIRCRFLLQEMMKLSEATKGFLMLLPKEVPFPSPLLNRREQNLITEVTEGNFEVNLRDISVRIGEGIIGTVAKEGIPYISTAKDGKDVPLFKILQISSLLSVPLKGQGGKTIGVVNLCDKVEGKEFNNTDQKLIFSVSPQVAIAIENFRLWRQSSDFMLEKLYTEGRLSEEILKDIVSRIESMCMNADYVTSEMPDTDSNKKYVMRIKDMATELEMIFRKLTEGIF